MDSDFFLIVVFLYVCVFVQCHQNTSLPLLILQRNPYHISIKLVGTFLFRLRSTGQFLKKKLQVILKLSKTHVLHLLHMLNIPLLRHILLLLQKNSNFSKKKFQRILSKTVQLMHFKLDLNNKCKINCYCEWRATRAPIFIHNLIILQLIILRILHPTPSLMGLLTLILVI